MSIGWIEDVVKDGKVVLHHAKASVSEAATSGQSTEEIMKDGKTVQATTASMNKSAISV
jgi:hypothetical protein